MTDPNWQPLLNLRFVERNGQRILQQAWGVHVLNTNNATWVQTGQREWRDVPLESEELAA